MVSKIDIEKNLLKNFEGKGENSLQKSLIIVQFMTMYLVASFDTSRV